MHSKAQLVVWPLLSHGAPVPVSQLQHWANTNRLSFIAVWQKLMRLEQNPPKTTTLSWGIIQSPNIRGKQEDVASSITQQESTPKKNTGARCAAIVQPQWHSENRMWWVSMPEVTDEPLCHQLWNLWCYWSKQWLHLCMFTKKVLSFFFLPHLEADKCIKKLAALKWSSEWMSGFRAFFKSSAWLKKKLC